MSAFSKFAIELLRSSSLYLGLAVETSKAHFMSWNISG
jgi:hypothetical protein